MEKSKRGTLPTLPCIRIDGEDRLILPLKSVWDKAVPVSLRQVDNGNQPLLSTYVQTCWNDWGIYIHFVCEDDYICATLQNRDDPLYDEDVVEVFICPDGYLERYYEFELSPRNVLFDAIISNDLRGHSTFDSSWNSNDIQTWVKVDKSARRVCYEMAIPFGDLGSRMPIITEQWRVNFFRMDHSVKGHIEMSAWQRTGVPQFHLPEKFGTLIFVNNP